ncbi:10770_t:CDS:2, partial [Racocetra persica]
RQQFSDDTEFSSNDPEQKSMRLIVAEGLYYLCSTTEYHDMPLIEINKCIDK